MQTCKKAIISVAGYGTRRMPITKTIEKAMLPFGNRPVVDYVVQDCIAAGITDIYFVVSKGSTQVHDYYVVNDDLNTYLDAKGKVAIKPLVQPPVGVTFHYVEQDVLNGKYGTTIPIWLCREMIDENELFLVVMGDDITFSLEGQSDIARLCELQQPAMLGVPIPPEVDITRFGVIGMDEQGHFSHIHEKPAAGEEPSRLVNVSKYVLPGTIMPYFDQAVSQPENAAGEYFITDPINSFVADGNAIKVLEAKGEYLDSGNLESWVRANQWLLDNSAA